MYSSSIPIRSDFLIAPGSLDSYIRLGLLPNVKTRSIRLLSRRQRSPRASLCSDPLLVQAARGNAISRPPAWMMRQAGRYMDAYKKLAKIKGFENGQSGADVVGWTTTVQDNGFVLADSLDSPDIICHRGATNAKGSVPVAAGDAVTITWDTWPESHVGPIIDYLAPCGDDCSTVKKEDLEFFKINEGGLLDGAPFRGRWVTDELIENNMAYTMTIPKDIKAGNYVLRHEIIALHEGQNPNGAQLYPQCINLEITGSGTTQPKGVSATTFYKSDDAGIAFSPYSTNLKYEIPGPALMAGGGSGSSPVEGGDDTETPAEPKPTTTLATSIRPSATATGTPATTEPANPPATEPTKPANPPAENPGNGSGNNCEVGTASLYGQCGGKGYSGPTSCAKGTCKKMNDYYSQCV